MLVFRFCLLLSEQKRCLHIVGKNVERFFIFLRCFDKFLAISNI
ncbi:hypothetical protein TGS27_1256 [Geobacillus stearothermophilus]|uniref:Uncharacterized protein n=1 Tax=Geobacillus stearothermophilus TaxID=1422 RepID=A0A150N3N0_GEOSE|nr:hypothetical protein GS8_1472 [Geobacillus stearothermophilus]KYD21090.1 hypothetical protein B4109_0052 [Geobacillus stearothermophilus]KYD31309.1 hypothetical protein B4114_0067 [Geobacillus stearothermophilus]OAO83121.1 hypothetical protein TGS27_1256 [Geobacillus stearothermophilus]